MSKSILVIDTPNNCNQCPVFNNVYTDMTCRGNGRTIDYPFPNNKIQDWCPLKEAPERKKLGDFVSPLEDMKVVGWNACLDEILKAGELK